MHVYHFVEINENLRNEVFVVFINNQNSVSMSALSFLDAS